MVEEESSYDEGRKFGLQQKSFASRLQVTQEVAVSNYRAYISAANALLEIQEEASSIDKHVENLSSEELKQTLLYTTMELERTRFGAHEEL